MKQKKFLVATMIAVWASILGTAQADTSFNGIVAGAKVLGCVARTQTAGTATRVQVECDQQKVIDNFPILQKMGLMNPDITQTQLNMMPSALAAVFLAEFTASLIHPLYQSTAAQETMWSGQLVVADAYGNPKAHTVFNFRFTRSIDARVNWPNFNSANLSMIAPGYALTPWGAQVYGALN